MSERQHRPAELYDEHHDGPQAHKREWLAKLRELRAMYGDTLDDEQEDEF